MMGERTVMREAGGPPSDLTRTTRHVAPPAREGLLRICGQPCSKIAGNPHVVGCSGDQASCLQHHLGHDESDRHREYDHERGDDIGDRADQKRGGGGCA